MVNGLHDFSDLGDKVGFVDAFSAVTKGIAPIIQGVGARIGGANYRGSDLGYRDPSEYEYQLALQRAQQGASLSAGSGGITGKIDSTTLLLVAAVAAIFLLER